jgi:hypothetical protein
MTLILSVISLMTTRRREKRLRRSITTQPIPADLQALIRRMARDNSSWGEERLANELLLKLSLRVSPRTTRKYLPKRLDYGGHHRMGCLSE